jgi:hypothetical protein
VREDREWDAGHAQGAVHLGKGVIEHDVERLFPDPDAEIVLYCGGGFRSALAADVRGDHARLAGVPTPGGQVPVAAGVRPTAARRAARW